MPADPADHHVSGFYAKRLLSHLGRRLAPDRVHEVLARAGESRPIAELTAFGSWSTYHQFRSLLEAAAEVLALDDPGIGIVEAGYVEPDMVEILQSLESPRGILLAGTGTNALLPIKRYEVVEVEPHEWTVKEWFIDGFEAYPEFCQFTAGIYSSIPTIFGFPAGQVIEEECQYRGGAACRYRIRWTEPDPAAARAEYLEARTSMLEARLEQLQSMVADLVSAAHREDVLSSIVTSTMRATGATRGLLALAPRRGLPRLVLSEGYSGPAASSLADDLLAGGSSDPALSVTPVTSALRHYGYLAIDERGRLFSAPVLDTQQTYARLAAAALDSVEALEESRHEASFAQRLLELATSLSEAHSVDQVLVRMKEVIPSLIDCDRVAIFLDEGGPHGPGDGTCRLVASVGYPEQAEAVLASQRFSTETGEDAVVDNGIAYRTWSSVDTLASATIPIVADGRTIGGIMIGVMHQPERLELTPWLAALLKGLAAQASIAVSNARLIDQVRFQAGHDTLTGLPNRALILDRAEYLLDEARVTDLPVAVLFLDLDGFKEVNDLLGHAAGDELLQAVTERLEVGMRGNDSIGRLGGDEFIVLVDGGVTQTRPELVAARLLDNLRTPFVLPSVPSGPVRVTASIGIAVGLPPAAADLISQADSALYVAKASGRNCFVTYRPGMEPPDVPVDQPGTPDTDRLHGHRRLPDDRPVIDLRTGATTTLHSLLARTTSGA